MNLSVPFVLIVNGSAKEPTDSNIEGEDDDEGEFLRLLCDSPSDTWPSSSG